LSGATPVTYYADADGDGYGNNAVNQLACSPPANYVLSNTDCNDANANIHPGATELCNGVDDNCDGQIDEGFAPPSAAGTISGSSQVFQGQTDVTYSVAAIANATGYIWTLPPGAVITSGQNTRTIVVSFGPTASSGNMRVRGTNTCGSGPLSPARQITVMMAPILAIGTTTVTGTTCYNATQTITVAGSGNTFLVKNGGSATFIAGSKILYKAGTTVLSGGYMLGKITTNGTYCGAKSLEIVAAGTGDDQRNEHQDSTATLPEKEGSGAFRLYPNPTPGNFTLELTTDISASTPVTVEIIGMHGERLMQSEFAGVRRHEMSLSGLPSGIYYVRVFHETFLGVGKIIRQ
jgi:hypothetical protein